MIEVGLDWQPSSLTGWGNYGANLCLELLRHGFLPVVPGVSQLSLDPVAARVFAPVLARAGLAGVSPPRIMLHAMGNGLSFVGPGLVAAAAPFGIVFLEDTSISPGAVARCRRLHRVVAGSSWNAVLLRGLGLANVELIPQGIDDASFHPAPRCGRLEHRFVVFSGGKLEYRKGQDLVVAAFRRFRQRHPEALLMTSWHVIKPEGLEGLATAGHVDGVPDRDSRGWPDLVGWLARNGIDPEDFLDLGVANNNALGRCLREADVALFPNRAEGGTNLVAMEAMACGLPTILSANTGHLDLVAEERCYPLRRQSPVRPPRPGFGVEGWGEFDVDEIVEILEQVYRNRAEAVRRGAQAAVFMRDWSWRKRLAPLVESIRAVCIFGAAAPKPPLGRRSLPNPPVFLE